MCVALLSLLDVVPPRLRCSTAGDLYCLSCPREDREHAACASFSRFWCYVPFGRRLWLVLSLPQGTWCRRFWCTCCATTWACLTSPSALPPGIPGSPLALPFCTSTAKVGREYWGASLEAPVRDWLVVCTVKVAALFRSSSCGRSGQD